MSAQENFDQVCAAASAEAAVAKLSDQALLGVYRMTEAGDSWVLKTVHGYALIEGAKRFFEEAKEPNFP